MAAESQNPDEVAKKTFVMTMISTALFCGAVYFFIF
jgi:hypothetical protein